MSEDSDWAYAGYAIAFPTALAFALIGGGLTGSVRVAAVCAGIGWLVVFGYGIWRAGGFKAPKP